MGFFSTLLESIQRTLVAYARVVKLVWQASPRYASLALLLTLVSTLASPVQLWILKVLIDRVSQSLQLASQGSSLDYAVFFVPVLLILAAWLLDEVSSSLVNSVRDLLSQQVENHATYLLLHKGASMDIAFYETPAFSDLMNNARQDVWRMQNLAFQSIELIGLSVSVLSMLALLSRLHPAAAILLVLTAVPHLFAKSYYANRGYALAVGRAPAQRMVSYLSSLLGSREAVKEVRVFGLDTVLLQRFREAVQRFLRENAGLRYAEQRTAFLLGPLSALGMAAILFYTLIQAASTRITIGDAVLAFQAVQQARLGLGRLFLFAGLFYEHGLYVTNVFRLLDLAPDSVEGALHRDKRSDARKSLMLPRPLRKGIEFRNVSFHYPRTDRLVLQNLSFVIHPGESLAIVGENGAGKTTLVKLLARLYDPAEGEILVDGRDLREYDLEDLRHQIGVIFQDYVTYHLTARENVGFGQVEFMCDGERVARAAELGGASPIIERLPNGFETMLGRTFEGGVDLSGGEWQKVALSRAFMRDAQLLILDEPTASLDALAELDVYRRFSELTAGKTTVFISHRFSTVRMAQHIIVLKEGRLCEEGTHDQLLVLGGLYAEMFSAQAERYR
jgi:ATP-binding cassette subfamily B protein